LPYTAVQPRQEFVVGTLMPSDAYGRPDDKRLYEQWFRETQGGGLPGGVARLARGVSPPPFDRLSAYPVPDLSLRSSCNDSVSSLPGIECV
jgi:hypothetical protein